MSNKPWFDVIVSRKFIYLHTNVNLTGRKKTYLINRYISVLYVISLLSYPSSVFEYTLTTKQYTTFYMLRTIRIQNQSKTTSRFSIIIIIFRCLIKLWIFTLWFISPPYLQIITKSQLSFCFNSIASKTILTFYLSIYFLLFFLLQFVAHPNCQHQMENLFYSLMFCIRDFEGLQRLQFVIIFLSLLPFLYIIYLFFPHFKVSWNNVL